MSPPDILRVVTINIWNKQGDWPRRKPLLQAELRALAPDLVGLQEVMHLDLPGLPPAIENDQARELAHGLGYHVAFGQAWDLGGGLGFGNGLLSRWPIVAAESLQLPGEPGSEHRALLACVVDSPHGRIPVFVTHLDWEFHHGFVRERQVAFIAEAIRERAPTDGFPPILMGDFNAEPEADEIRFLRGWTTRLGRSVYFADCFAAAGDGSPGYTFARSNRFALATREPSRRIDYLFVRGPDKQLRGEPLTARLCFTTPEDGVFPSDHYGVYAEIQAAPRRPSIGG